MSDPLWPHGLKHARLPCPSPCPGVCSDSCPLSDAIQPSRPLSPPSPAALNLSLIRVFSRESPHPIRWPKSWSLSLRLSPSDEYSGLGLLEDWLVAILAVQGTWEVGSHFLLQGILPTQEGKPGLLHCRQILYRLSQQRSPKPWTLVRWMILASSKTTRCLDLCTIFSIHYKGHLGKDITFSRH